MRRVGNNKQVLFSFTYINMVTAGKTITVSAEHGGLFWRIKKVNVSYEFNAFA